MWRIRQKACSWLAWFVLCSLHAHTWKDSELAARWIPSSRGRVKVRGRLRMMCRYDDTTPCSSSQRTTHSHDQPLFLQPFCPLSRYFSQFYGLTNFPYDATNSIINLKLEEPISLSDMEAQVLTKMITLNGLLMAVKLRHLAATSLRNATCPDKKS